MLDVSPNFDQQFDEAVAWFARRTPLPLEEWSQLQDRARRRAFTVAGLAQLELVRDVQASLEAALASGVPFEAWRDEIGPKLRQAWAENGTNGAGHRLRVIWRNNVQLAYSAGRYHQMTDPDVLAARPYWLYDSVLDSGTTDLCRGLNGTLLPATSSWWKTHFPPLHHQCRSGVRTVTEEQAQARGISEEPTVAVPDGWGQPPGEGEYVGDPNRFDPAMWGAHLGKLEEKQKQLEALRGEHAPAAPSEMRARLEQVARDLDDSEVALRAEVQAARDSLRVWRDENGHRLESEDRAERRAYLEESGQRADAVRAATEALLEFVKSKDRRLRETLTGEAGAFRLKVEGRPTREDRAKWFEAFDWFQRLVGERPALHGLEVKIRLGRQPRSEYNFASQTVLMYPGSKASRVAHELAHWLEHQDPGVLASAVQFYARRTAGDTLEELRDLTGLAYKKGELTKKDQFLEPYMGRWYALGGAQYATELVTVGIEMLYDEPLRLARLDPDYFDWLWRLLKGAP